MQTTKTTLIVLAAGAIAGAGAAQAGVTSIGEFTGEVWEGFENIAPPGSVPGPVSIMGGAATGNDLLANNLIMATSLHSFITDTQILPWNGNFMAGVPTGWAVIEFETPVVDFGGWFGTADELSGGSVVFFDAAGAQIDSVGFHVDVGAWEWFGWSSNIGISRIEVRGNATPGGPIVLDDLRANFIPAPGAAALLALGGLAGARRRRA